MGKIVGQTWSKKCNFQKSASFSHTKKIKRQMFILQSEMIILALNMLVFIFPLCIFKFMLEGLGLGQG